MQFDPPLIGATLVRRYKRFFADVVLDDGRELAVLCSNTGRMLGCAAPGMRLWLSESPPTHRMPYAWELSDAQGVLVGVAPWRANHLVAEALAAGRIPELSGYTQVRREVTYGDERSRIDFRLAGDDRPAAWVEVKSVTAADSDGLGLFPDAVSLRAAKHMRELARVAATGARAVALFCVQRGDALAVRAADEIDPAYGRAMREAAAAGVELLAYRADVSPQGIALTRRIPVLR